MSSVITFGDSAMYHTGRWSERVRALWKRIDHASIFILIAGSYTPFTLLLLGSRHATILLSVVWGGAVPGVAFRLLWVDAPHALYVRFHLELGWIAVGYGHKFLRITASTVFAIIVIGGLL